MSNAVDLLRMLEPAVRPVAQPGSRASQAQPFESQSFESLLSDAAGVSEAKQADPSGAGRSQPNPLASLQGLGAITNVSLRQMMQSSPSISAHLASDGKSVSTQGVTP